MTKMVVTMNSKGFTLIELVISIIILGILSITAAPKFLDLGRDSRIATLEGAAASLHSAAKLVHSKAHIEGKHNLERAMVETNLASIELKEGYPEATTIGESVDSGVGMDELVDTDLDYCYGSRTKDCFDEPTNSSTFKLGYFFEEIEQRQCYVTYSEVGGSTNDTDKYQVTIETEGC